MFSISPNRPKEFPDMPYDIQKHCFTYLVPQDIKGLRFLKKFSWYPDQQPQVLKLASRSPELKGQKSSLWQRFYLLVYSCYLKLKQMFCNFFRRPTPAATSQPNFKPRTPEQLLQGLTPPSTPKLSRESPPLYLNKPSLALQRLLEKCSFVSVLEMPSSSAALQILAEHILTANTTQNVKTLIINGHFIFADNAFKERHLAWLGRCLNTFANIEELVCIGEEISDLDLTYLLEKCPKLQENLKSLNVKKCGRLRNLAALPSLENLQKIDLSENVLSQAGLQNLRKTCAHLQELRLSSCKTLASEGQLQDLTDNHLNYLLKGARNLRYLDISGYKNTHLLEYLQHLPQITHLDCSWSKLNEHSLENIKKYSAVNLEELHLAHLSPETDLLNHLANLSTYCRKLQKLDISWNILNETCLEEIGKSTPTLRELNLATCSYFNSLAWVKYFNPKLEKINLRQVQDLSPNAFLTLPKTHAHLSLVR